MHEMSIIANILQIAADHAREAGATTVTAIELEVGALAGVEIPALEFCFTAARGDAVGDQANLVVHETPGRGRCPACDKESPMDFFVAVCPDCGEATMEILQGRELKVRSIQVV